MPGSHGNYSKAKMLHNSSRPRVLVVNDTYSKHHPGTQAVMSTLLASIKNTTQEIYTWPVGRDWRMVADQIVEIKPTHCIVNGEGTIHHTRDRPRAAGLLEFLAWSKAQGIKTALVNATLFDVEPRHLEHAALADAVMVRDSFSRELLDGVVRQVAEMPDLSLLVDHSEIRNGVDRLTTVRQRDQEILFSDSVLPSVADDLYRQSQITGGGRICR